MYIGIVLYVLIVFSLHQKSLKLILVDELLPEGILSHRVPSEARTAHRRTQKPGSPYLGSAKLQNKPYAPHRCIARH
jgi:hypothetical protein